METVVHNSVGGLQARKLFRGSGMLVNFARDLQGLICVGV